MSATDETAAERTMRHALENPEVLEVMTRTLYLNTEWRDDWDDLSEWEKEQWRDRAIEDDARVCGIAGIGTGRPQPHGARIPNPAN